MVVLKYFFFIFPMVFRLNIGEIFRNKIILSSQNCYNETIDVGRSILIISQDIKILGCAFSRIKALHEHGGVLWCNYDLLHEVLVMYCSFQNCSVEKAFFGGAIGLQTICGAYITIKENCFWNCLAGIGQILFLSNDFNNNISYISTNGPFNYEGMNSIYIIYGKTSIQCFNCTKCCILSSAGVGCRSELPLVIEYSIFKENNVSKFGIIYSESQGSLNQACIINNTNKEFSLLCFKRYEEKFFIKDCLIYHNNGTLFESESGSIQCINCSIIHSDRIYFGNVVMINTNNQYFQLYSYSFFSSYSCLDHSFSTQPLPQKKRPFDFTILLLISLVVSLVLLLFFGSVLVKQNVYIGEFQLTTQIETEFG